MPVNLYIVFSLIFKELFAVLVRKAGLLQCFKIYYYIKETHKALCQLAKNNVSMSFHFLHQWACITYFLYNSKCLCSYFQPCSFRITKLLFHYVV